MSSPPTTTALANPNFESGNTGWTLGGGWIIENAGPGIAYDGNWDAACFTTSGELLNDTIVPIGPGMSISANCKVKALTTVGNGSGVCIAWYNASMVRIGASHGNGSAHTSGFWENSIVNAVAPANTAYAQLFINGNIVGPGFCSVDAVQWNYQWNRTAQLVSPIDGTVYETGAVVTFQVSLGGTVPAVQSVTYKRGATVIGTVSTAPYTLNTSAIPDGTYTITAEVNGIDGTVLVTNDVEITIGATPESREYKASNTYTNLIAENFVGLSANMPATAVVTGVEVIVDYTMQALVRAKDLNVADPTLASENVAFDITNDATIEAMLLNDNGTSYTPVGGTITDTIPLLRSDFEIIEDGLSEGKRWVVLESTAASVTLGGETELFGVNPIAAADFAERSLGIRFYPNLGVKPAYADTGDTCFRFFINKLRLRVYFDAGSAEFYFASPDKTQVIKGTLVSSYVTSGDFETSDAEGVLQLLPELEIIDGTQSWIGADWTIHGAYPPTNANQIGEVAARQQDDGVGMAYNSLPGARAIIDNRSRYEFIVANFFADKALDSIYGAHGLPRAFAYNGDFFYKIYTQPDPIKDSPRHVAYHHSHLALGFDEGRVDISVVGQPYNFDGGLGASSWSIGDKVVGLLPLSGTILGVFGSKSIWGISGTTVDNFATQVISPNIGAIEYTITDMGYPVYANAYGIYTLSQTQQYGDYLGSPMSQDISPWLRPRLIRKATSDKEVVVAWPVRSKNQYRLGFADGYILSMTLNGQQAIPTFSFQKYFYTTPDTDPDLGIPLLEYQGIVPAAISSELDDSGEERIHVAPMPPALEESSGGSETVYEAEIIFDTGEDNSTVIIVQVHKYEDDSCSMADTVQLSTPSVELQIKNYGTAATEEELPGIINTPQTCVTQTDWDSLDESSFETLTEFSTSPGTVQFVPNIPYTDGQVITYRFESIILEVDGVDMEFLDVKSTFWTAPA